VSKVLERYAVIRVADNTNDQLSAAAIQAALLNSITQEDLQTYFLSQMRRIIWGDLSGTHWYDDFISENVAPLYQIEVNLLLAADPVIASIFTPTYTGNKLTHELWANPVNSHTIKTVQYTYTSSKLTQEVRTVYAGDGVTIWGQITVTYSYSGSRLISETVVRNV
jgi:hypothetical protein